MKLIAGVQPNQHKLTSLISYKSNVAHQTSHVISKLPKYSQTISGVCAHLTRTVFYTIISILERVPNVAQFHKPEAFQMFILPNRRVKKLASETELANSIDPILFSTNAARD